MKEEEEEIRDWRGKGEDNRFRGEERREEEER